MKYPRSYSCLALQGLLLGVLFWGLSLPGKVTLEMAFQKSPLAHGELAYLTMALVSDDGQKATFTKPVDFPKGMPFQVLRRQGPSVQQQSSVQIINGKTTQSRTITSVYQFLLNPLQEGTLTIPAFSVECNGKQMQTTPVTVNVLAKGASPEDALLGAVSLKQEVSPSHLLPGGKTVYSITLRYPLALKTTGSFQFLHSGDYQLTNDFEVEAVPNPQTGEDYWEKTETVDGIPCHVISFKRRLTPKRQGAIHIPPLCTDFTYASSTPQPNGTRSSRRGVFFSDIFDDPFFTRQSYLTEPLYADEITLDIQDFPEEGKPQDFSGLLGPLQADLSLEMTDCFVGDPIPLTLILTGESLSNETTPPQWEEALEADGAFRLSGDTPPALDPEAPNALRVSRTLRPLKPGVFTLPSLTFSYYDPDDQAYETTATKPLTVTVQSAEKAVLGNAAATTHQNAASPAKTAQPTPPSEGPASVNCGDDAFLSRPWSPLPGAPRAPWLLLILLPVVLLLADFLQPAIRQRILQARQRRFPWQAARRKLENSLNHIDGTDAQASRKLSVALEEFLKTRLALNTPFSLAELKDALTKNGVAAERADALLALQARCQAILYGNQPADPHALADEIRQDTQCL